ncbi:hypothetical protein VCSRO125_3013 [Vibrio cholerae]|nr:hypothetical protein VCSRO125_3013 [Vibrio cholerae]
MKRYSTQVKSRSYLMVSKSSLDDSLSIKDFMVNPNTVKYLYESESKPRTCIHEQILDSEHFIVK